MTPMAFHLVKGLSTVEVLRHDLRGGDRDVIRFIQCGDDLQDVEGIENAVIDQRGAGREIYILLDLAQDFQ